MGTWTWLHWATEPLQFLSYQQALQALVSTDIIFQAESGQDLKYLLQNYL